MESTFKQFDYVQYKDGRKPIPLGYVLEILDNGSVVLLIKPELKRTVRADKIKYHSEGGVIKE